MKVRNLKIGGRFLGIIRARKVVNRTTIYLTENGATWWVVTDGPDRARTVGFVHQPQQKRAREVYDDLSMPHVLGAFLEGQDS